MPVSPPDAGTSGGVSLSGLAGDYVGDRTETQAPVVPLKLDGTPRKKPGRKPGQKTGAPPPLEFGDSQTAAVSAPQKVAASPAQKRANRAASEQIATQTLHLAIGSMAAFVGPEWQCENQEEADGLKAALTAYIEVKGDGELSPEAMLALVFAGYAMPRFSHPNTREKIGGFFGKCWKAITGVFKR